MALLFDCTPWEFILFSVASSLKNFRFFDFGEG
jgi:hypothetical protein